MQNCRPTALKDFIGQDKVCQILGILCRSAKAKQTAVSHVLLSGPPGLGKTTLARIIAGEMGSRLIEVVASHLQTPEELAAHLKGVREGDIVFIDELHGLPRKVEEVLYSTMDDFRMAIPEQGYDQLMRQLGVASSQPTMKVLQLPSFTLVGATTLAGLVSDPLRSRFVQSIVLEPYSVGDLIGIILNAADRMRFPLPRDSAEAIARRSRQTARVAIGHLRWIAEFCGATGRDADTAALDEAFDLRDVDEEGFRPQRTGLNFPEVMRAPEVSLYGPFSFRGIYWIRHPNLLTWLLHGPHATTNRRLLQRRRLATFPLLIFI